MRLAARTLGLIALLIEGWLLFAAWRCLIVMHFNVELAKYFISHGQFYCNFWLLLFKAKEALKYIFSAFKF